MWRLAVVHGLQFHAVHRGDFKMRTNCLPVLVVAALTAACSSQPPAGTDAATPPAAGAAPAAEPAAAPSATRGTAPAAAPAPAEAPPPAAPPAPRFAEVTLPAGTQLSLRLGSALASDRSAVEDPIRASLRRDLVVDERTVLPAGTDVRGVVTSVERSAKVKGRASLAVRFTSLSVGDETYDIRTSSVSWQAEGTKKKDATKIGIGAGAGAIIGGIVGGGKGAAVGTAVGAGTGTGVVLATRGEEVHLAEGTPMTVKLTEPLTVRVALR
jgi:hypothetical protein